MVTRAKLLEQISARADELARGWPDRDSARDNIWDMLSAAMSAYRDGKRDMVLDCAAWSLLALEKIDEVRQ